MRRHGLRSIYSHTCSVAYSALESAGEMHAHRAVENELVALPSSVAQPLSR